MRANCRGAVREFRPDRLLVVRVPRAQRAEIRDVLFGNLGASDGAALGRTGARVVEVLDEADA
ncbi:hypothetical protein ACGFMO_05615 [Streptomyces niveus]|uniref:hypothetical protein n=1 Tax=Streptomyces niveus TaxID=193462 RepID=UPI00371FD2C7